ncbi:MAG TPA: hypothetical protein VF105_14160 [Gemmatimonadaceae bacterium]
MQLWKSVSLVALLAVVADCRDSNATLTPIVLGVSSVAAPSSISSGEPIDVTLNVQVGGCLAFDRLEVRRSDSGATMVAWGHDITEGIEDRGIACTRMVDEAHAYSFDPPFANTFTISVARGRLGPLITTVAVH